MNCVPSIPIILLITLTMFCLFYVRYSYNYARVSDEEYGSTILLAFIINATEDISDRPILFATII